MVQNLPDPGSLYVTSATTGHSASVTTTGARPDMAISTFCSFSISVSYQG